MLAVARQPTPTPTSTPCGTFSNPAAITINDAAVASPYPSTINVSGLGGTVTRVTVRLIGLSHTFPDDIDMLLVGPGGHVAVLHRIKREHDGGVELAGLVDRLHQLRFEITLGALVGALHAQSPPHEAERKAVQQLRRFAL